MKETFETVLGPVTDRTIALTNEIMTLLEKSGIDPQDSVLACMLLVVVTATKQESLPLTEEELVTLLSEIFRISKSLHAESSH